MAAISAPRGDVEAQTTTRTRRRPWWFRPAMPTGTGHAGAARRGRGSLWDRLSGPVVGYRERVVEDTGVRPRPLVAASSGPTACFSRRRTRRTGFGAVFPPLGRQDALGGVRRPIARAATSTRRTARRRRRRRRTAFCVYASFGSKGTPRGRFRGPHCLAPVARRDQRSSRHRWFSASLQGPADSLSGSQRRQRRFVAAFDRDPAARCGAPRGRRRPDGARRIAVQTGDHDEIIVSSQQRVHAIRPRHRSRAVDLRRQRTHEVIPTPVVGHGLVFCSSGTRRSDARDSPGRQRRRHQHAYVAWQSPRGSPFVPLAAAARATISTS